MKTIEDMLLDFKDQINSKIQKHRIGFLNQDFYDGEVTYNKGTFCIYHCSKQYEDDTWTGNFDYLFYFITHPDTKTASGYHSHLLSRNIAK